MYSSAYKILAGLFLVAGIVTVSSQAALAQASQPGTAAAAPVVPPVVSLRRQASEAYYKKDYLGFVRAMEELHQLRPYNGEYMYQLVLAYALNGQKTEAYNMMLIMQRQGLAYNFADTPDSMSLRGTEVYQYLNDQMIQAGQPHGSASRAFALPDSLLLPEAFAWDPNGQSFLVGSVVSGEIYRVSRDGKASLLVSGDAEQGPWGVFDIAVDSERSQFWVTSRAGAAYGQRNPGNNGQTMLSRHSLEDGKLLQRYPVTDDGKPHGLANLVVAPDGTVYIGDSVQPMLHRLQPGDEQVEPYLVSGELVSVRGLAIHPRGHLLYVADHEKGILLVDVAGRQAQLMQAEDNLNLGGIDGLYFYGDNHLVLVQNAIQPERIMRLELDANATGVKSVRPLQVAHHDFDLPSYGAVVDNEFWFMANSHWPYIGPGGKPQQGQQLAAVQVLKVGLDSGQDLGAPDIEKARRELQQKAQEKIRTSEPD